MRFNYLNDAAPYPIEQFRDLKIHEGIVTPLWAASVTVAILTVGALSLSFQLSQARSLELVTHSRFLASRVALEDAKIQQKRVVAFVALDRELQRIRLSGSKISMRLADIANHVPAHTTLTSITHSSTGIAVEGRSSGLDGLSETIALLMRGRTVSSPILLHAEPVGGRPDDQAI